jgi:hypothetical protein
MLFQLIYDSIGFDKKMIVGRFVVLSVPVLFYWKLMISNISNSNYHIDMLIKTLDGNILYEGNKERLR